MNNTSEIHTNIQSTFQTSIHGDIQPKIHKEIPTADIISQTTSSQTRSIQELNMMDAFLFDAATEDVENAKKIAKVIIERVTGQTVSELIVESQKQLKGISIDKRGIRMDIYVTEKDKHKNGNSTLRVYDIEPNKYYEIDLPHRSRFYQSLIDSKLLSPKFSYITLPEVITIWILPYDPFGEDRMLYTVKNMVVENNKLEYNDGITKIFLFTKGTKGGSKKLKDLLTYLENTTQSNAVDEDLLEIQKIVGKIKSKEEMGERYMTLQEMIDYEKRDSYEDGLRHGIEHGMQQGIQQGIQGIINTCKSLNLNKSQVKESILNQFDLTDEQVEEYINLYW